MTLWRGALWAEIRKLRRSKISVLSLVVAVAMPVMMAFFMKVLVDPAWADRFGLLTSKARATAVTADWSGYLTMLTEAVAVGGFGLFGIVTIWVFGREFSDHTVKDLLALPAGRPTIVIAKIVVVGGWCAALAAVVFTIGLGLGRLLDLPGWSGGQIAESGLRFAAVAALTILVVVPFGLAGSVGRGYLPAVGAMFAVVVASQILAALGLGSWFPWSVPGLLSGAGGPTTADLPPGSYFLVIITALGAAWGTAWWWSSADQT